MKWSRRSMPVPLAPRRKHRLAGAQQGDRLATSLYPSFAFRDVEALTQGVAVPSGAGSGSEVHVGDGGWRKPMGLGNTVDVHVTGEPVGRPFDCRGLASDFHAMIPFPLGPQQGLDGPPFVHRSITLGGVLER